MTFEVLFICRTIRDEHYNWKALYQCFCGNKFEAYESNVKRKKTASCGCAQRAAVTTHGLSRTPTYYIWMAIKQRCYNHNTTFYKYYGGRGIEMSAEWNDFETFLADMGERPSKNHSIDRIDNDGNYCKENCQWLTKAENSRKSALASGLGRKGDI